VKYSGNSNVFQLTEPQDLLAKLLRSAEHRLGWLDFFRLESAGILETNNYKDADVVHLHNLHGGYFSPFLLPKITKEKPVVWTFHDMQPITTHGAHSFDGKLRQDGFWQTPSLDVPPAINIDAEKFICKNKELIYHNSKFTVSLSF
jgi:hypothetical protein